MESLYKPEGVEERWQRTWEIEGHYNADPDPSRESFVIAHPPPNVTGDLHMGHALQLSLADTIVRMRRMQGYNTLFQPGFDHAGISTQNAVEKHLAEEGKTRQDLGRQAFEARVWEWLREYGGKNMLQFRRIGASMDYRRERVTPGHDPLDYEIGRDHGLPEITVIGPDGRMNEEAGELVGLTQDDADARVLEWLKEHGQLEKRESFRHTVAVCDRCKTRIEPRISLQWWCSMDELRKPALEALRSGRGRYHPESQHRFAIQSLEEAPDWNISRQIWWGHQLPVWECPDGHITVAETEPEACVECRSHELTRSTDVLDTWFSSALWPFAARGWPEDTEDLRAFYPGDLNTTARDIIRLWENRMIFSGLEMMGDVPFRDVVIHSLVHAPTGGRMFTSPRAGQ